MAASERSLSPDTLREQKDRRRRRRRRPPNRKRLSTLPGNGPFQFRERDDTNTAHEYLNNRRAELLATKCENQPNWLAKYRNPTHKTKHTTGILIFILILIQAMIQN